VLVLAVAWSALGMQIHVCSGPLTPESGIQTICRLFFAGAWENDPPVAASPEGSEPTGDEEDAAETPLSQLKALCPPALARNLRRVTLSGRVGLCAADRSPAPRVAGLSSVSAPDPLLPPADSTFLVCRLLF
jgi:hypothetical protein